MDRERRDHSEQNDEQQRHDQFGESDGFASHDPQTLETSTRGTRTESGDGLASLRTAAPRTANRSMSSPPDTARLHGVPRSGGRPTGEAAWESNPPWTGLPPKTGFDVGHPGISEIADIRQAIYRNWSRQ